MRVSSLLSAGMTDQTRGGTVKVTKVEGKCGTCGLGIRKGEDHSKAGRMLFHASYEGCSEAQNRKDAIQARDNREAVLAVALRQTRYEIDSDWWG